MLTAENFLWFLGAFFIVSAIGYKWGVIERAAEITLEESYK